MAIVKAFVSIHRWHPSLDQVLAWVRLVRLIEHSNRFDFSVYWSYYSMLRLVIECGKFVVLGARKERAQRKIRFAV